MSNSVIKAFKGEYIIGLALPGIACYDTLMAENQGKSDTAKHDLSSTAELTTGQGRND